MNVAKLNRESGPPSLISIFDSCPHRAQAIEHQPVACTRVYLIAFWRIEPCGSLYAQRVLLHPPPRPSCTPDPSRAPCLHHGAARRSVYILAASLVRPSRLCPRSWPACMRSASLRWHLRDIHSSLKSARRATRHWLGPRLASSAQHETRRELTWTFRVSPRHPRVRNSTLSVTLCRAICSWFLGSSSNNPPQLHGHRGCGTDPDLGSTSLNNNSEQHPRACIFWKISRSSYFDCSSTPLAPIHDELTILGDVFLKFLRLSALSFGTRRRGNYRLSGLSQAVFSWSHRACYGVCFVTASAFTGPDLMRSGYRMPLGITA
ncbi:hypothetical protein K491DRAFT_352798 [Lophiostoma macrostomum CBS 122681]|uniref:Uncharacterized protein n=1 Tax=Lophiostoma macrostomum CBS 122681 TaxID=1314788 RepID=A0A6A6TE09_9PLEO|nr:hypothetical protein K491DRAFT_352798 [Lophiostoma macrostomum CBS 122681]